jgi:hypothetical protein
MPTRAPEEETAPSPWRFPYFNPNRPPFDRYLANLAEGQRQEIPLGSLGGFIQWGIGVARGVSWPPQAPITAQGESLSSSVGPAEVSYPPANLRLRVPSKTLPLPGGGSVTLGGQAYARFEWRWLNSVSTLGYETTWRVTLPDAGDLPPDMFPATTGTAGGYVKVYGVRMLLATALIAGALYGAWWLGATSPGALRFLPAP